MPVRLLQVLPGTQWLVCARNSRPCVTSDAHADLASAENEKTCMIVFCGLRLFYSQSTFCDSHVHTNAQHSAQHIIIFFFTPMKEYILYPRTHAVHVPRVGLGTRRCNVTRTRSRSPHNGRLVMDMTN